MARLFGEGFARQLEPLPLGTWSGPVRSPYGLHLVLVEARSEPFLPPLEAVRAEVAREVAAERARAAHEAFVAGLRERYQVVVEMPAPELAQAGGEAGARW